MTLRLRRPVYRPSVDALIRALNRRFGPGIVRVDFFNASSVHMTAPQAILPLAHAFADGFFVGRSI